MKYYRDNQDTIAAEIEKARLQREMDYLRTIAEGRRKKAREQRNLTENIDRTEVNLDYIEPASRIIR